MSILQAFESSATGYRHQRIGLPPVPARLPCAGAYFAALLRSVAQGPGPPPGEQPPDRAPEVARHEAVQERVDGRVAVAQQQGEGQHLPTAEQRVKNLRPYVSTASSKPGRSTGCVCCTQSRGANSSVDTTHRATMTWSNGSEALAYDSYTE
ncbi:RING finger protein 145, partial [Frankliniella fusca]